MQHIVVVNLVCLPRYILEHDTTPLQMYLITLHTTLRKKRSLHRSSLTAIFWVLLQGQYCDVSSHLSLLHAHCSHSFRGQRAAARWRMCCCRGSSRSSLRTSGGKNAVSANYQQSARDSKNDNDFVPNKKLKLFFHQKNIQCCRTLEIKK